MLKKRMTTAMLAFVLAFGGLTGCSDSGDNQPQQGGQTEDETPTVNRDIRFPDMGLSYTLPDLWVDYMESNIYFEALTSENVFGKLTYYYVTTEDYEAIKTGNPLADISKYLYPLCTIAIIHKDNVELSTVQNMFREYDDREKVGTSGDYEYYLLSGTRMDTSEFTEEEDTLFLYLRAGVPSLKNSIATSLFDPDALKEQNEKLNSTITFITQTLEGEDIDSTVFRDYDVTVLNLTAAYALNSYDESATLQELYTKLQADYPNVNLIQGAIDTPNADAEALMKEAKAAVNGTYTSIMMDDLLRTWVTNNLPGVPVTLLIDSDGTMIGEMIVGMKTTDEYLDLIQSALEEVQGRSAE